MKELLEQYTAYNLWANKTFSELFRREASMQLDRKVLSSFESIRKTAKHIHDAENVWRMRLEGISLNQWPGEENMEGDLVFNFHESSDRFHQFISKQPIDYLAGECQFTNLQKKSYRMSVSGIVMHCMNHSTFHRGQLITMMRTMGMTEFPSTDLIAYLRTKPKQ